VESVVLAPFPPTVIWAGNGKMSAPDNNATMRESGPVPIFIKGNDENPPAIGDG
jgi:hypothetical protein